MACTNSTVCHIPSQLLPTLNDPNHNAECYSIALLQTFFGFDVFCASLRSTVLQFHL